MFCNTPGPLAVRIACGSTADSIANETGYVWSKDFGFSGGKGAPTKAVNGIATHLNSLRYFDSLDGPQNCYNISVPSGHYLTRFAQSILKCDGFCFRVVITSAEVCLSDRLWLRL